MDGLSKHTHGQGSDNMCRICNAKFEHDFLLASHMRTHSSTVKSYTKKPKINEKTEDIGNQVIKESEDAKVEENVKAKWFDNAKETFYKADGERESIKDLGNYWSAESVKQDPDDIKICDEEVKIEADELIINTEHRQTNVLDESKLDKRRTDGVKKEQENWYEVNIEPTEIYFLSEVQRQKHQRTIIICEDSKNINEKINNSLNIVKEEQCDSNEGTGFVEASTGTGPCLVKLEPPEVPDGDISSEPCLAGVKTEYT
ncbi:uncharacterized protein LOC134753194 [Cydia strobilella]|uniref:uncharacterized protein LOC134753194 n=1 Tax=Cydia strobilella TaxID=1100964 RepID=UPI003007CE51